MSLNDSSSLILIVGAIAILAFVVHGLWFSGKSVNRKLSKDSLEDQELSQSKEVGKVRIVVAQEKNSSSDSQATHKVETYNKQHSNLKIEANLDNTEFVNNFNEPKADNKVQSTYELHIIAPKDRPFTGLDLEELCSNYGFIRDDKDLFCVYEDPQLKDKVVFKIASLDAPYAFPKDMKEYKTSAIALYMQLPAKGKAFIYFKAMNIAANCFVEHLNGVVRDSYNRIFTQDNYDEIARDLALYDKEEN